MLSRSPTLRQRCALIVLTGVFGSACGEPAPPQPDPAPPIEEATAGAEATEPARANRRRMPEEEGRRAPAASPQARSEYETAMVQGAAALYSGQFDVARGHYLRAMDLRPEKMSPALGALRAMAPRGHGEERSNVERTIQRRIDALLADPKTRGAGELLAARMATALGEPGSAMNHARVAASLLPELGAVWRALGEASAQAELWSKAAEAYGRALELGLKARAGTLERLADVLDELGDYEGAEKAAREAVELTGSDTNARRKRLNLLSVILKHRGSHDEARRIADDALSLGPEDPAVLHNLASLHEARGKLEEAEALYRRALTQSPVPMTSWRLGHVLLKQDRRQEAVRALTDAAARLDRWSWPESTRWWPAYDVGRVYALAGHERESIGWFEDAMREARSGSSMREVRTWLTWARVQAGLEKELEETPPDR